MAQRILRHADRDAIFHEPSVIPAGGPRSAGQVIPFPQRPHHTEAPQEELPEHDWTQHGLGDPEHWEQGNLFRHIDAALDAQGNHQFPGVQNLSPTGESTASTHGAQVHQDPANGEKWLIKPTPSGAPFLAHGDVAANAIQQYSGLKTPPTFLTEHQGAPASAQLMIPATDAYPAKSFDPEKVPDKDLMTLQKHHALDWLLGNHDSHGGQFIRDQDGDLVGIDKGQSFKHYSQDRLHWNYHPNSAYHEQEPVYNTLYRNFAQGGRQLNDPRQGELGQFIQHLQNIPDDEYRATLTPYATGAAERGSLGKQFGGYSGHAPGRFSANDPEAFLQAALARKNNLSNDFGDLYERAFAHRMTGTKIAAVPLNVLPGSSIYYRADSLTTNVVEPGQFLVRQAASPDCQDIRFGNFGPWASLPYGEEAPLDSFSGVDGCSAQMKMGGLNTDFSVAPVQNLNAFGDGPAEYSVGSHVGSHMDLSSVDIHSELAVSPAVTGGRPVPAPFSGRRGRGRISGHEPMEGFGFAQPLGSKFSHGRYIMSAPPHEHEMQDEDEALGTNQRAHVFSDPQGQWIIKKPTAGNEYMVPLDVATAALQRRVGLETPETHAIPFRGELATAAKRYPQATQAFAKRPHLNQLDPHDQETIQKHHALDWLIGNHDAHIGNWLRTGDGQLVGIDKGQALKYFGQDRLDPTFHPNYYAREPIYNRLWRDHAQGQGEMADPRAGPVGDFVKKLQSVPDEELKGMFAPYAHAAAQAGQLATGGPPDPDRKLSPRSVPANDPEAFLDAMVARKNNLHNDLGGLYDRSTKARSSAQRAQSQAITPGLDPDYQVHTSVHRYADPATPVPAAVPSAPAAPTSAPAAPSIPAPPPAVPTMPAAAPTAAQPPTAQQGLPQVKGYDPNQQQGWNALGIPTGIPSSYHGPWHPNQGQESVYGGTTTTLGPGDPGYGHNPAAAGAGGAPATPSAPGVGGPTTPTNYAPAAGVEQWQTQIEEALRRNGLPVTPDYVNKMKTQIKSESGGDPKAINRVDTNAQAGHPSQGLLQTIPSTFQQHHLPGDSNDITDPQANLDAAVNYAKGRYGPTLMDSSGNGIGSGHGY
jgi:hypothetical protein